ncbi:MAG: WGR domain-containing protein [Hyphomicrobiaceae bacterium]
MPHHLVRIDAGRNLYRFYRLDVQADLFGAVSLIREWGRIGQGGTVRMASFATESEAQAAAARALTIKQRRGYRVIDCPQLRVQETH